MSLKIKTNLNNMQNKDEIIELGSKLTWILFVLIFILSLIGSWGWTVNKTNIPGYESGDIYIFIITAAIGAISSYIAYVIFANNKSDKYQTGAFLLGMAILCAAIIVFFSFWETLSFSTRHANLNGIGIKSVGWGLKIIKIISIINIITVVLTALLNKSRIKLS